MTDDTEHINLSGLTHIPRWMFLITLVNLVLWWGVLPLAYGLRQGLTDWFQFAVIGLLIVPVQLMILFIGRLIYYFITLFYWYFIGLLSLIGILIGGAALVAAFTRSAPAPFGFDPTVALKLVPDDLRTLAGIVLVVITIVAVFLLGRFTARKPRAIKPGTITPALTPSSPLAQIGAEEHQIRQQLRQRARDAERLHKR